jgi:hypothetical protein
VKQDLGGSRRFLLANPRIRRGGRSDAGIRDRRVNSTIFSVVYGVLPAACAPKAREPMNLMNPGTPEP